LPETTPIEIWFEDEARIGQTNGQVRRWAKCGTRPRQPADQRYDNAYLFGAFRPARGVGAALALPRADTDMMQLHLDEISRNGAKGAHAVLLLDRAGWRITGKLDGPDNITPIFLPSRAPELNPVENLWQYLRTTGSQTLSSKTTTPSATPHAKRGENSSPTRKGSHPSQCEIGPTSVNRYDPWYHSRLWDDPPLLRPPRHHAQKDGARGRAGPPRRPWGARPGSKASLISIPNVWSSSTRPGLRPRWLAFTAAAAAANACMSGSRTATGKRRLSSPA
jgi:DDE superfamily endonuclease